MSSKVIRQQVGQPHFKELVWNKPETKALAGKMLVIGGNKFGISSPSEAYASAIKNGAGDARAVLPDSTKKLFGGMAPPEIQFAKSSPSGSFSKEAINDLLAYIEWADLVLFAGDFSRSSETGILIETILKKSDKPVVLTLDALDYFAKNSLPVLGRKDTTLIASFTQLQSLLGSAKYPQALTFSMPNNVLSEYLQNLSGKYNANIITARHNYIYVVSGGGLSITEFSEDIGEWRLETAVKSGVWLMHNPNKAFEALTTSISQM